MPAPAISSKVKNVVVAGEDTTIVMPGTYRLGSGGLRPVILCHGAGQDDPDTLKTLIPIEVAARGYCVMAGDFGGAQTWGNALSSQRVTETLTYARNNGWVNATPPVFVGLSMGILTSLNWIRANMADTAGVVSMLGAFNLQSIYERDPMGVRALIDAAYGGTWDPATHATTRDPNVYVDSGDLAGLDIITFYGANDTVVLPEDEASFATRHTAAGGTLVRNNVGPYDHETALANIRGRAVADAVETLAV